jgi:hypothetical protein
MADTSVDPMIRLLDEPAWDMRWSPDGQHLLIVADSGLYVASGPDFAPVAIFFIPGRPVWFLGPAR